MPSRRDEPRAVRLAATALAGALAACLLVFPEPAAAQGLQGVGGAIDEPFLSRLLRGLLGLAFLLGTVWVCSAHRRSIRWPLVAKGLGLQIVFALLVLKTGLGRGFFTAVNDVFVALIGYTNAGSRFLFGSLVDAATPVEGGGGGLVGIGANFAFAVLPTIIFFSSLMALAYHLGVMQRVVRGVAWAMQRTLGTSGAETTSAAGNIFVGQTEAPLLIRPFVDRMTMSELNTVMTGGFATVAGRSPRTWRCWWACSRISRATCSRRASWRPPRASSSPRCSCPRRASR